MRKLERGYALVVVLVFLGAGALFITPTLSLAGTVLKVKQLNTYDLAEQYARDGAAEHALWTLQYGGGLSLLTESRATSSNIRS